METSSDRKASAPRVVALLLIIFCVFAIICFGLVYYVGDLAKYQEALSVREGQAAMRGVNDPAQLDQALEQLPKNSLLKLVALANRELIEIDAAVQRRLKETEPAALSKPLDLRTSGRGDLEALRKDLQAAQGNAATSEPGYLALVKAERGKIDNDARSLKAGSDTMARFTAMLDEQDREMMAFTSKVLAARVEYYRAYEKCADLLVREFGTYKVENGQFVFPFQHSAESYNRAVAAMDAAAKRMAELEDGRAAVKQEQFKRWKTFAEH